MSRSRENSILPSGSRRDGTDSDLETQPLKQPHTNLDEYSTIDWAGDSHDLNKRRTKLYTSSKGVVGYAKRAYFASQGWIAVTLVGLLAGVVSAYVDLTTEWVSDIKQGICLEFPWATRNDCCFGQGGHCTAWKSWGSMAPTVGGASEYALGYFFYVFWAVIFAVLSSMLVLTYAPFAAGSGIPELKTVLGGFNIKKFLGFWTLVTKTLGLSLSVGSGLAIGKEGPMVHLACCLSNVVSRLFPKFHLNEGKKRELISAGAAAGISVAFNAPIGGVLFSLEEASTFFPHKTLWRSFFCAIIGALVLRSINTDRTGSLQIKFQFGQQWHWFDVIPFIFLGVAGGLIGVMFSSLNIRLARWRKKSWPKRHPVLEVFLLAFTTAVINYSNPYLKDSAIDTMFSLFGEGCAPEVAENCNGFDTSLKNVQFLASATVAKFVLMILAMGIKVPAGIFVPSLSVGATLGRLTGLFMFLAFNRYNASGFFDECTGNGEDCIVPGMYALVGAAAVLAGVTRVTVAIVVIMFEATAATEYLLPVMLAVMIAKWVGDAFGKDSIYEKYIHLQGYPYIDTRIDVNVVAFASDVMTGRNLCVISSYEDTVESLDDLLANTVYQGFPIVNTRADMILCGYITRTNLEIALEKAKSRGTVYGTTRCLFTRAAGSFSASSPFSTPYIDLSEWVDRCPVQLVDSTPVDRMYDMFKALGLRYTMITSNGKIVGMVTKKDLYLFFHNLEKEKGKAMTPLRSYDH